MSTEDALLKIAEDTGFVKGKVEAISDKLDGLDSKFNMLPCNENGRDIAALKVKVTDLRSDGKIAGGYSGGIVAGLFIAIAEVAKKLW